MLHQMGASCVYPQVPLERFSTTWNVVAYHIARSLRYEPVRVSQAIPKNIVSLPGK